MTPTRKVAVGAFLLGSVVAGGISLATLGNASAAPSTTATTVAADDTDSSTPATDSADDDQLAGAHRANGTTEGELSGDTATETDRGDHGRGGGGGPHAANGVTEEELSGDAAASVEAAVVAAYPDATIERMETDAEGSAYEAHVTLGDGSKTTIKLDASFAITGTSTTG